MQKFVVFVKKNKDKHAQYKKYCKKYWTIVIIKENIEVLQIAYVI